MKRKRKGAIVTGFRGVALEEKSGELEIELQINEHLGRCFLSREMWFALGEQAGWCNPLDRIALSLERIESRLGDVVGVIEDK